MDDVPKQAVSMTVYQILQCRTILSCVPHAVKADAVYKALYAPQDAMTPAAHLRSHPDWTLYIDRYSAEKILTDHIEQLHGLARLLIEREKIDRSEFLAFMEGRLSPSGVSLEDSVEGSFASEPMEDAPSAPSQESSEASDEV